MTIWFTSDTHFFHRKLATMRGFGSPEEMNEKMRDTWNSLVQPKDQVYHMGDHSFAGYEKTVEFTRTLNGVKHLILGNHDDGLIPKIVDLKTRNIFASIGSMKRLKVGPGEEYHLAHYGHRVWRNSHYGAYHLYGHSHGHLEPLGRSVDVGVDANWVSPELRPYHLDEVRAFMAGRELHEKNFRGDYE
jgi:calcineurin-like phosphoesterase family protein